MASRKNRIPSRLTPDQKKILLSAVIALAVIILFFSFLSRYGLSRGQTLAQYAANAPEPSCDDAGPAEGSDAGSDAAPDASPDAGSDAATAPTDAGVPKDASENTLCSNGASQSEYRQTYRDGFYMEPLSEELAARIMGVSYPAQDAAVSLDDLCYVHILHIDFDGKACEGELVCNRAIGTDLLEIFYKLYAADYRIGRVTLIDCYGGDAVSSMADNNTSCFNHYAADDASSLPGHAYGLAVDVNPLYNPYVQYTKEGGQLVLPEGSEDFADRSLSFAYKIDPQDLCYALFTEHGFTWGGNWNTCKAYQHFQKALP